MKLKTGLAWLLIAAFLSGCGKGVVEVDNTLYEPKIVVEAFLYPGHPVDHIKIMRNFPLNSKIQRDSLYLPEANVMLSDDQTGANYTLSYDSTRRSFSYPADELIIAPGRTYTLHVQATIEGQPLEASSTTTTPLPGFAIDTMLSTRTIRYLEHDLSGTLIKPQVHFQRSPGVDFYAFSIIALDGDLDHFIRPPRNPFIPPRWEEQDIVQRLDDLRYSHDLILNTPLTTGEMDRELQWFHFMFYGRYRIIGYASDQNFKDYFLTFQRVIEMDGNLHEPVMHFTGDGIGVFASAVTDTLFLTVTN